jgi:hypothetical protein
MTTPNPLKPADPALEVNARIRAINQQTVNPEMDEKELADREEAAKAYAGEDESHFVRYMDDCVDSSVNSMIRIRENQRECWDVYNEEEPPNYRLKEAWQARVIVPKPFSTVQFSMALVRKAFDTEFLSIENDQDKEAAEFWKKLMTTMLSRNYANFPITFTDATGMGFAVGQSMEMIPVWRNGKGLRYVMTEPWKIHRDPDAISRQPQSGMYWVHQEWIDYYVLKEGQKNGKYTNVEPMGPGGTWGNPGNKDYNITKEELARRKNQIWSRSGFRSMCLTSEFWGTVLDKKGELLLPNATFTSAGNRVISPPKVSPYPSLRWPGISFSPLPHFLRFDGRALIQGIKSLWYFMNSLMCLHADNLNWVVNPPSEIDISALVDQNDIDNYPAKQFLTKGSAQGQQVVRTVDRKSNTSDILADLNYADQRFQEGSLLNYTAQGLPGFRDQVTAREAAQNLDQSMTIVGQMGKNLEDGALSAIIAGAETVAINISYDELVALGLEDEANRYQDGNSPTGLKLPDIGAGTFHVSGVTALMKDQEIIHGISQILLPLFNPVTGGQVFVPYMKPYQLLRSLEKRLHLEDEGIVVTKDDADRIDQNQQAQQEAQIEHQKRTDQALADKAQAEADETQSHAELNIAEAGAHGAKAELSKSQAVTAIHKAGEHIANIHLKKTQAEALAREPQGQETAAEGPSEEDQAKAEQIRALIPHDINHKKQEIDTEKAAGELTRAKAKVAAKPPQPQGGNK